MRELKISLLGSVDLTQQITKIHRQYVINWLQNTCTYRGTINICNEAQPTIIIDDLSRIVYGSYKSDASNI